MHIQKNVLAVVAWTKRMGAAKLWPASQQETSWNVCLLSGPSSLPKLDITLQTG